MESNGDIPGIGALEILRVLLPRDCPHCGGLLLASSDDPGLSKCSECSRTPGAPAGDVAPELASSAMFKALTARADRSGAGCIPQASLNSFTSRFA